MNPFLEACGATAPLQLSVECQGAPRAESVTFDLPFVLIGSDPGADLHFPHKDVSERHVYLQMAGGHLCYMDLGSRMGTYLGGKCLRSGWLMRGKTIRIGPYRVRLVDGDVEEWPAARPAEGGIGFAPPPLADASPPRLTLEISHRGIRPALCPIHGELTLIGSSIDCDVRIIDPSVSNYHCSLLHTARGIWVVDLLGSDGVTLNGAVVRHARLEDGDELRVGFSYVRVRTGSARSKSARQAELSPTVLMSRNPTPVADLVMSRSADLPAPSPAPRGSELALDSSPDKTELIEAILAPLIDRFAVMQQQMFEQLHQAGMVMFERFSTLHEEQVRNLQRELDEFRMLTRELNALRTDLETQAERPIATPPHNGPTRLGMATACPSRPPSHHGALALIRTEYQNGNSHGNGNGHGATKPRPEPPPSREPVTVRLGTVPEEPAAPSVSTATKSAADPSRPAARRPGPDRGQDADIHSWLCQRITMIQDEQQSRWQKILNMIPGQLLGKPTV